MRGCLSGCITSTRDLELPLILTPEQYHTHKRNRSHLFERLESLAYEYPLLIVGGSPSDPDLRATLIFLASLPHPRPRSYLVMEHFTATDERMWNAKNITCLRGTFQDCLNALDQSIPQSFRKLASLVPLDTTPLSRRVRVQGQFIPSPSLNSFLEYDADFLHEGFAGGDCDPKAFYRGFSSDWAPIEKNLDVRRTIADDIASEVFLDEDEDSADKQQFYLVSGHAGSGKSVALRRLAWDAAKEYNKLCLFMRPSVAPQFEPIQELFSACKDRIFIFIDRVADHISQIETLLQRAKAEGVTITLVGTMRSNAWSGVAERLEPFLNATYELPYLDTKELDVLISLLETHDSIGSLGGLPREQQRELLAKKSGRQLLVALLEATLGKPLSDIILDEFKSINDSNAQSLYITTCILHRLNVPVRAGLISRVHGISYSEFAERLFSPLKYIVFAKKSTRIQDYEYQTRHPHIAEIVFERALDNSQDRFDEYVRILGALDVDYITDRDAMRGLTSARELLKLFSDFSLIRQIYKAAHERCPKDASLHQQEAIFEMNCGEGHFDVSSRLLKQAKELAPWNRTISHSLAELSLKRADTSKNRVERATLRYESKKIIADLKAHNRGTSADTHTLLKVHIEEFKEVLDEGDPPTIERKVKELEKMISEAHQSFPNDSYILDAEAKFLSAMNDSPRALTALKKAFQANKRSPYLALTLAKSLERQDAKSEATRILQESLDANPLDKELHFALARLLIRAGSDKAAEITYHLRQSFTTGDTRYEAQFWYARQLYINGEIDASYLLFRQLRSSPGAQKRVLRARIRAADGAVLRTSGSIVRSEASSAKVKRDQTSDILVARASDSPSINWRKLTTNSRVTFSIGFSLAGPTATDLSLESPKATETRQTPHTNKVDNNNTTKAHMLPASNTDLTIPTSGVAQNIRLPKEHVLDDGPIGSSKTIPSSKDTSMTARQLVILSVATEWSSGHGGLSTFNREFCLACARIGHDVYCYVPNATEAERLQAEHQKVKLLIAPGPGGAERLFRRPPLPVGVSPDIIIGHGRVTGPAAMALVDHFPGSRRIHFLHVAPGAIEWFKDRPIGSSTDTADERERLETELAQGAHQVVAVGSLLQREYAKLLHPAQIAVHEFLPGLSLFPSLNGPPLEIQILVLGRAEDSELKGLDLATRAVAQATHNIHKPVVFLVRGAAIGMGDQLRDKLLQLPGTSQVDLRIKPYTSDASQILSEIRQSSLVLMPSRSEGFGLVGLEAISAGVPVLLSDKSGLAELVNKVAPEQLQHHVVDVTRDTEKDVPNWAKRIEFVLLDRTAAFERVRMLRSTLEPHLSWDRSTTQVLSRLVQEN